MFYKLILQRNIVVAPQDLGRTLYRRLIHFLREAVEGRPLPAPDSIASISVDYHSAQKASAVVVAVLDVLHANALQGKVLDNGSVSFRITYAAIVLKLHRGEVLDLIVSRVGVDGCWGDACGVGKVFVSHAQMSSDPAWSEWSYEYDGGEGFWMSADHTRSIRVNDLIRVRVIAETPQSHDAIAIATMAGPFLGPL
ncbi:unnamed protein product [Phytomonas sp. EM1]|nr:unnamed protein product [Phytomonas sp. EM1]|eukprot:CCW62787.1 unnamed protein product [Phytomonas sp. isolate EM1]